MAFSDYSEEKLINHLLGNASFTQPTSFEISLHTGDPGESGFANEVSATNYARQSISWTSATASGGAYECSNDSDIQWSQASSSWGTISYWAVADGSGNQIASGAFASSKSVGSGDTVQISQGSVAIDLS